MMTQIPIEQGEFERILELAKRFGWTFNDIDGSFDDAVRMIEEALNVRIEDLDRMVSELAAANARIRALESALRDARAAMQPFRVVMDVPNTDITEIVTVDYTCEAIDKLLSED